MNANGSSRSSQLSSLLESLPGIASVLRSPVADAIIGMIRAAIGLQDFSEEEASELIRYAVRRGLIPTDEGDRVLAEVEGSRPSRRKAQRARESGKKALATPAKRPVAKAKPAPAKRSGKNATRPSARKPAKKKTAPSGAKGITGRSVKKKSASKKTIKRAKTAKRSKATSRRRTATKRKPTTAKRPRTRVKKSRAAKSKRR